MRSRNVHVQLWLTRKEAATLARRAKACGITQSAYLSTVIKVFAHMPQKIGVGGAGEGNVLTGVNPIVSCQQLEADRQRQPCSDPRACVQSVQLVSPPCAAGKAQKRPYRHAAAEAVENCRKGRSFRDIRFLQAVQPLPV